VKPEVPAKPDEDPLIRETRLRRDRRDKWLREGDMSVGRRLAQIGVLGWIFVTPTLAGLFSAAGSMRILQRAYSGPHRAWCLGCVLAAGPHGNG
jgi:hypothetical protein